MNLLHEAEHIPVLPAFDDFTAVDADYGQHIGLPKRKNVPFHIFIPMAQPYAGFAKALLESQHYPDLRDATGRQECYPYRPIGLGSACGWH